MSRSHRDVPSRMAGYIIYALLIINVLKFKGIVQLPPL